MSPSLGDDMATFCHEFTSFYHPVQISKKLTIISKFVKY